MAQRGQLRGNMRQAARLRGYFVNRYKAIQRAKNCAGALHGVRCGVHSNHRISASVQQPLKSRHNDAGDIVCGVIRLNRIPGLALAQWYFPNA